MYHQSAVQNLPERDWILSKARDEVKWPALAQVKTKYVRHVPDANQTAKREAAAAQRLKRLMGCDDDIKSIVLSVCAAAGIEFRDIIGHRRQKKYVLPRHEIWWRVYDETGLSMPDIACRFGRSDHTTIKHGIEAHERRMGLGIWEMRAKL